MKKVLYTLLAVSIVFAACKKEDEVVTPVAASIVGVWTPTSVDKDSSMTTTIAGEIVEELDFGDGPEVLTYSGSETMTPAEAGMEGNLEFTSDGKMFLDGDTMNYTYSNSVLTVTDSDTTMLLDCSFTETNLSLTMEFSMDTAFNEPMLMLFGFANGDMTISAYMGQTIHCSRNTMTNNNVSQRVGNTNHSWFVEPKFNNILKSIK
jgi:hypothetical protein